MTWRRIGALSPAAELFVAELRAAAGECIGGAAMSRRQKLMVS
jgi:hypothetical protein